MAAVYTDAAHIADGVIGLKQRSLAANGPTEGALSSSPVHRALVLVLGTNIAVLLDCPSRLDSVAFLTYLLTPLSERPTTPTP